MKTPMPDFRISVSAFGLKAAFTTLVVAVSINLATVTAQPSNIAQVDERIVAAYGTDHVNRLLADAPHYLDYLAFYLDHGFYVYQHPDKPGSGLVHVSEVAKNTSSTPAADILPPDPNDISTFNALQYYFARDRKQRKVYLIDGTGMALVFYSDTELSQMYNEAKAGKQ